VGGGVGVGVYKYMSDRRGTGVLCACHSIIMYCLYIAIRSLQWEEQIRNVVYCTSHSLFFLSSFMFLRDLKMVLSFKSIDSLLLQ